MPSASPDLYSLIRPAPIPFPDECQFPTLEPEDATRFPKHEPSKYPQPAPGTIIPDTVIKLVDTRSLTPDQCLAIARLDDPWYCLPKDHRGKPHRKQITSNGDLRRAYFQICLALRRAQALANLTFRTRWEETQLAHLETERDSQPPPAPNTS